MTKIESPVGRFLLGSLDWTTAVGGGAVTSAVVAGGIALPPVAVAGLLALLVAYAGGREMQRGAAQDQADTQLNDIRVWLEGLLKQHGSLVNALAGLPDDANLPQGVALDRIREMTAVLQGGLDGVRDRLNAHPKFVSFIERSMKSLEESDDEFRVALNGLIALELDLKRISQQQLSTLNQILGESKQFNEFARYLIADLERKNVRIASLETDNAKLQVQIVGALERAAAAERLAGRSVDAMLGELRKGHPKQLLEFLDRQIDDDEANLIQRHRERAAVAYVTGDIPRAKESLLKIDALRPDDVDATNRLAQIAFLQGDYPSAEQMFRRFTHSRDPEQQAIGYCNLGHVLRERGDLGGAETMHSQALELNIHLGRTEGVAIAYGNLGLLYLKRGDYVGAEKMLLEALGIEERIGRLEGMANATGNLGLVHQAQGKLDEAEKMLQKALEIEDRLDRLAGKANAYGNLGVVYARRGKFNDAESMYLKSLEIEKRLGRRAGEADMYGNLGIVFAARHELDRAERMHRKALEIDEELGRLNGVASQYANIGVVCAKRGDLPGARDNWQRAVDIFSAIGAEDNLRQTQMWIDSLPKQP